MKSFEKQKLHEQRKWPKISRIVVISLYHQAYNKLDKISLENSKNSLKILVLIDDLDRCFPENSIKLLESIKLVLSQPGFLFMIGVSRVVLEEYLQHKYEEQYGIKGFEGRSYMDKIIQLSFEIPPHTSRMNDFAAKLISKLENKEDKDQLLQITDVIGAACNNNPRTVVRFINRLLIDRAIYNSLQEKTNPSISIGYFAVTRSLQQRWSTLYFKLIRPENIAACRSIAQWNDKDIENWKYGNILGQHIENVDDTFLKSVAENLSTDNDLKQLLLISRIGKSWLVNDDLRKTTIEFIIKQPRFQLFGEVEEE